MDKTLKILLIVVAAVLIIPVLLAALGGLLYFGMMTPDHFLPERCSLSGGFSCVDESITSEEFEFRLINNLGVDVVDLNITVESRTTECTLQETRAFGELAN